MEGQGDKGLVATRDNPCRASHTNKAGRVLAICLVLMLDPTLAMEGKYENVDATWGLL